MNRRDDDDPFRVKPGPPKSREPKIKPSFISQVIKRSSLSGRAIGRTLSGSRASASRKRFGRGQVAAQLAGRSLNNRSRRVTVQIRSVQMRTAVGRSLERHVHYVGRDSATRDGQPGRLFNATSDDVDRDEFVERSQDDRHHFRMMISPEDGTELGDLKTYTRDLMRQVERDLGTRMEWVAADHWDTDRPHIHIVLKGTDERGKDLIIAPEYITQGMRARASEIATQWLGPRTELEIQEGLRREVRQERWTSLDRTIAEQLEDGRIIVRESQGGSEGRMRTSLTIGRLDHLAQLGLAKKTSAFAYEVSPDAERTLRAMGERGDIVRTMQRAMGGERREYVLEPPADGRRIVGRIAGKGLVDEFTDQGYMVVDGIDGRAHYFRLSVRQDLDEYPIGGIIEIGRATDARRADVNIEKATENGIYDARRHLEAARVQLTPGKDPDAFVQSHVRRLEALRRANIVERLGDGRWAIPADFATRAQQYDARRAPGIAFELRSHLPIREQTRALGPTWLDRQLVGKGEALSAHGFGAEVRTTLARRTETLIERGFAERRGQQVVLARNLLDTLRTQDIESTARRIGTETGLTYRPAADGKAVSGVYRVSVLLTSGRFAILDDATGFSLVPWRPVLENRLGQSMTAVTRGHFSSFEFGRKRGLSI